LASPLTGAREQARALRSQLQAATAELEAAEASLYAAEEQLAFDRRQLQATRRQLSEAQAVLAGQVAAMYRSGVWPWPTRSCSAIPSWSPDVSSLRP
jgi:septal ring factor EnvC (AmiA/AmiB activator)